MIWEGNGDLRRSLSLKMRPVVKDLAVPVEGGFVAKVRLLLPPGLNENDKEKYPMIVNV